MVERRNIDEGTPTTMRSPGSAEASETQANAVEADPPRRRTGNATALRHLGRLLARTWIVLVLLVAWQLWIAVFDIHRLVMPPPRQVFLELVGRPTFYIPDILTTIYHASLGLLIGMLIGVALSLAAWYSRVLSGMVAPPALMAARNSHRRSDADNRPPDRLQREGGDCDGRADHDIPHIRVCLIRSGGRRRRRSTTCSRHCGRRREPG